MSAFVCDDKTINRIVGGLNHAKDFGDFNCPYPMPSEELKEIIGDNPAEFGRALYSMNVNAVEQRYPDCVGNPDRLPGQCNEDGTHRPYRYQLFSPPERYQFHKTLQCFLYQCMEGDVDELPLYKLLTVYLSKMANQIVTNSPTWEKAEWG